jgi:uncharacterized membrane protein SirB2
MLLDLARSLATTPLNAWLQAHTNVIAFLQAVHIVMLGLTFGSTLLFALRVLGRFRADESVAAVWTRFAPWLWSGLVVMAMTGALLAIAEPVRQASALSYWLKMGLILVGIAALLALRRNESRGLAWTVIATWVAILFLGRAIAYDVEVWGSWSLGA